MDQSDPVKERPDPVPCTECGRVNWSNLALCVYCRLGWPDPGDMRGVQSDQPVASTQHPERQVDWTSDGQALRRVLLDDAGRICEDVTCIRCKYNLRSLRHGDACPECSESVERSLWVSEMAAADPRWLKGLSGGAWFLAWGLTLVGLTPVFLFLTGILAIVALTIGKLLAMIGVFRLTTLQAGFSPSYEVAGINERFRLAARYTAIAIPFVTAWPFLLAGNFPVVIALLVTFVLVAMVGVCGAATMELLGTYAERMSCKTLAVLCRVIAVLFATIIGVELLVFGVAVFSQFSIGPTCISGLLLPLGVWTVVVVIMVARELDAVLKIASSRSAKPQ